MATPEEALAELGLSVPEVAPPVAVYVPAVRTGNHVYTSGQLPMRDGQLLAAGKVPSQASIESAQQAARQCVLNALAAVKHELGGDLSKIRRVVRVGVFVQSDETFDGQPKVANGASDLLQQLLGAAGQHARAAVGVNALPLNAAVEIEFAFEVD